jgi:hypothetical protein
VELNPGFEKQKSVQQSGSFHRQLGLQFQEEGSEVLHLKHSFHPENWTLQKVKQKFWKV